MIYGAFNLIFMSVALNIKFLFDDVVSLYPDGIKRQTFGSSGIDLRAHSVTFLNVDGSRVHHLLGDKDAVNQTVADNDILQYCDLLPGHRVLVGTGMAFAIDVGYEIQVRSRSGLALKNGLMVINSPGTIDSDYRGEIGVPIVNLSDQTFRIHRGDRIAQAVVCVVPAVSFDIVSDLPSSVRGEGGFGSTGLK